MSRDHHELLKDQNDLLRLKSFFSPSDPSAWSRSDLDRWIRWTMNQYNIPDPSGAVAQQWATTAAGEEMDGQRFLQLSEQDFRDRMPQVSSEARLRDPIQFTQPKDKSFDRSSALL